MEKVRKTNEEWKRELPEEVYAVTREGGTEPPFSGQYYLSHEQGTYRCSNCGQELFSSDAKYDSGSGWPSFWTPLAADRVELELDDRFGMRRTEVRCARCGAHLGHVFDDGPADKTGKRYCINSLALDLEKQ